MSAWITEAIGAITGTFTALLTALPSAVVGFFDGMFLTAEGKLTTVALLTFVFIGIGFVSFIVGWVRSKI